MKTYKDTCHVDKEGGDDDDWMSDFDDYFNMEELREFHESFCETLKGAHTEISNWNNAVDAETRQEIESNWGEEITKFFEDFMDGATTYAVAGSMAVLVSLAF